MARSLPIACISTIACLAWISNCATAAIGEAVAVIQQTNALDEEGERILSAGGSVFVGDEVRSGPIGEAQLLFVDDTRLVVGPDSALRIDTYLLRNPDTVSNLTINAVRGTFRFITGASPSGAYEIQTPTATIGVRGTSLDVAVQGNLTGVVLYSGSADVCDLAGRCEIVTAGCGVAIVGSGGVSAITNTAEKAAYIQEVFPYAFGQDRLRPDFQVNNGTCLALLIPPGIEIDSIAPGEIGPTSASPQ